MRVFEKTILIDGDMSVDFVSPTQQLVQVFNCAIQASWTGTPVGAFNLNITNDDPDIIGIGNVVWSTYTGSSTNVSGPGNFLWNLTVIGFNFVQVQYMATSGSGLLNISCSGKGH